MSRIVFDCARMPGEHCSLQLIGEQDEVLSAAKQHLVSAHGHQDGEQLHENVSQILNTHAMSYHWI